MKTKQILRECRRKRGITQRVLAAETGYSVSTIQHFESDRNVRVPTDRYLRDMIEYFNIDDELADTMWTECDKDKRTTICSTSTNSELSELLLLIRKSNLSNFEIGLVHRFIEDKVLTPRGQRTII